LITEIYIESFLLINFAADFLIIVLCSRFLGICLKYTRAAIAALIGSIYSLISVYFGLSGFVSVLCNVFVAVIMCAVSYKTVSRKAFVRSVIVFYITAMLLAGALTALLNVLYKASIGLNGKISMYILLLATGVISFIFTALCRFLPGKVKHEKVCVTANLLGNTKEFCFLCDTGNLACDPYSGKAVVVVKSDSCKELLGKYYTEFCQSTFPDTFCASKLKMRLVPVKTAAGQSVLRAFSVDKAYVHIDGKKNEIDVCFALDMTRENTYDGTDGVFPYSLVSGLV